MKNKYGLLGLVSILGIWGLYENEPTFLSFLAFIPFFQYLFVIPDESFKENMKKASSWAFFTILVVTILSTFIMSLFRLSSYALVGGCTLGFSMGIVTFCFSTMFIEWQEKRGIKNDF